MVCRTEFASGRRHGGFTLVELMITVVIASILVAIAVPSYTAQVRKSRRTDARNAVLDVAAREERNLSVSNSYSNVPTDLGYGGTWPATVMNGYYTITVVAPDPTYAGTNPSFVATATYAGIQVADTACKSFSVNQIGQQTAKDSGGADATATCWGN